jgi:hypothetical protein
MRCAISAFSLASLLAFAPGCDSEETVGDDFRASFDVSIQMTTADGGGDDGSVVWEVVEAAVYEGPAIDGNLLLYIENNAIFNLEGVQTCQINSPYLNSSMREVIAANGSEILFTVWGNYVFEGEIDIGKITYAKLKTLFPTQLLFEYTPSEIYLGEVKDGHRLMTTNSNITEQSEGRKLLMAALIAGECGSLGLPGYTF